MQPEDCQAPYFEYHPSWRGSESEGDAGATEDLNLEYLPELGLEVTCFLQGPAKNSEVEDVKAPSPKPPIEELGKWLTWKAQVCKTPNWWQELTMVPEVDDHKKLACEVRASFQFPKKVSEQCLVENDHQAPPTPMCLCWKNFPCFLNLSLPAKISGKSSIRRWWCMPRPFSFGWRKLICLLEVNHAFWWGV